MQGKGYDRRVSVIDLASFTLEYDIDVAPNLSLIRADKHGRLWVASRGDYQQYTSRLYQLNKDKTGRMVVTDSIDTPVSGMFLKGDSIYFYGATYDASWKQAHLFGIIDVNKCQIVNDRLINIPDDHPVKTAYGIMVHPSTGDIYIMDATNFVSSGSLTCFDRDGQFKWTTRTGDIPGHAVFLSNEKTIRP